MRSWIYLFLCGALLACSIPSVGLAEDDDDDNCIQLTGNVDATLVSEGKFARLWKYTVDFRFDDDDDLEDLKGFRLFLGLDPACPCICYPDVILFDDISGQMIGKDKDDDDDDELCNFVGSLDCRGNPNAVAGFQGPTICFTPPPKGKDDDECDSDDGGSTSFTFFSMLPPGSQSSHVIKIGDDDDDDNGDGSKDDAPDEDDGKCVGSIQGTLPVCECPLAVEAATWGTVKHLFN